MIFTAMLVFVNVTLLLFSVMLVLVSALLVLFNALLVLFNALLVPCQCLLLIAKSPKSEKYVFRFTCHHCQELQWQFERNFVL